MQIDQFLIELRSSLRLYDKRDMIDDASVYRWIEIALKKFGADISVPKEVVVDIKKGKADMPGDYYDLILAYKCDFKGYDVPEGDKVIPELQNTIAWKERTEKSYKWCSCDQCCKEEHESTIVEKFYINVHDRDHEVRCFYDRPTSLRLAKPMLKDKCLNKCRNKWVKESEYEINIINGYIYANFDGPVYMKYKSLPFDGKGNIFIPDTPQGLLADYIENFVKMRLFEEWMFNGEVQGAAEIYKLYQAQDLIKFRDAKTEVKMMNWSLSDWYKPLARSKKRYAVYENIAPKINNVIKIVR